MQTIKVDLDRNIKEAELHVMADLHLGDRQADKELIKQRIEHIKNTPNAFVILNGDLMNNATKTSVSDSYAEELTPMQQIAMCSELFEPIRNKILAITTGNHERRTYNKEGIDLMEIFAREMKLTDRFSKGSFIMFLRFGHEALRKNENRLVNYTIFGIHGSGGGRKEGAKAIRLADMGSIADADVYIHSHTHMPMVMKQSYFRTSPINRTVQKVDRLFINTAATLNYGGYGEVFEYKPASKETPVIYLDGERKYATARL